MRPALLLLGALLAGCGGDDGGITPVPDTQPPDVTILSPLAGGVSGSVEIRVAAFDNRDVVGVSIFIDDAQIGSELTTAPYTIIWNTTTETNGQHVIGASARDAAGFVGNAPEVTVTVTGGV